MRPGTGGETAIGRTWKIQPAVAVEAAAVR